MSIVGSWSNGSECSLACLHIKSIAYYLLTSVALAAQWFSSMAYSNPLYLMRTSIWMDG